MSKWHVATRFNTNDGTPSDTRVDAARHEIDGEFVVFLDDEGLAVLVIPVSALLYAKRLDD